jgi:hypothetical protein
MLSLPKHLYRFFGLLPLRHGRDASAALSMTFFYCSLFVGFFVGLVVGELGHGLGKLPAPVLVISE